MDDRSERQQGNSSEARPADNVPIPQVFSALCHEGEIFPQSGCASCSGAEDASGAGIRRPALPSHVYAIGRTEVRFPSLSLEKEFAQATKRTDTAGKTDRQAMHAVISQRENRYLARQVCWVFNVQGLDTYLLAPRDPVDLDLFIEAVRPSDAGVALDCVVGMRGPNAPPDLCNGLTVPIVIVDQLFSFTRAELVRAIPMPAKLRSGNFEAAAEELFDRVLQIADNAGSSNEHRALNYLVMRYPTIYTRTAEAYAQDSSLTGVMTRQAAVSGTRKIVEVIFAYTNRSTAFTEKFAIRVDVSEEFPFLVSGMAPFYDREMGSTL